MRPHVRPIADHSALILAKLVGQKPKCGKIQVARKARREFSRLFSSPSSSPIPILVRQDGKFFFSRSSRRDRDRDQLRRGKVEEGLILYLNTGLSRRTTCILTTGQMPRLSRCPVA